MKFKPIYLIGLLALLYWRHHNDASVGGVTRAEESTTHNDGTNFQSDLWGVLSGVGLASPNFPNIIAGSPNADPGGNAAANLGLQPAWDGSLK